MITTLLCGNVMIRSCFMAVLQMNKTGCSSLKFRLPKTKPREPQVRISAHSPLTYTHTLTQTRSHTHSHTLTHTHTHTRLHSHTRTHTRVTQFHTHTHTQLTHTHTLAYIHTHTHTRILHTHTHCQTTLLTPLSVAECFHLQLNWNCFNPIMR